MRIASAQCAGSLRSPVMTRSTSATEVAFGSMSSATISAPHHDDAVDRLKHMIDIVSDEHARMAGIAGVADEAQNALRFRDAEVVRRFVEDD
jgi:hypothetical protein